ncbi:MAG: hypothetical protein ACFFDN_29565 [Candidatus Hodarchaeota archaeon]
MRIAIVGTSKVGGGNNRMKAYKYYLQSKNHYVDIIQIPFSSYVSKIWFFYQRVYAQISDKEPVIMKKIANKVEKIIRKKKYDAIIGVDTRMSYFLTKDFSCLKLFSCESLEADQLLFHNKNIDLKRVQRLREMELEIMMKSDYVIFPWETTENYVRKNIWNGDNFITIKYGCYPKNKTASYFFPPSIISLGTLYGSWTNKELLSYLTRVSHYPIHVYGKFKPQRKYHLNYKGFASSLDIYYKYQFGLNTISKDPFRKNHFSSRILGYLAVGLPVLSPEWFTLSNELKGCLAYNEDTFNELVEEYSDREKWQKLCEEATKQGRELDWKITLKPLEKLLEK